jgi:hypothetical protein
MANVVFLKRKRKGINCVAFFALFALFAFGIAFGIAKVLRLKEYKQPVKQVLCSF